MSVLATLVATALIHRRAGARGRKLLRAVTDGISSLRDRDFSVSIAVDKRDEFGELIEAYNSLGAALRSERQSLYQRELLLDTVIQSTPLALVLTNLPSRESLFGVDWWRWPSVAASGITLSIAHWVGFITLVGIVSRNGILMVSHYIHLVKHEGETFSKEMILRGTLERLAPVLMTALTAILGLIPLALGAGQTGKELLHPLAIVVIGGLLFATLMDQLVTPALFWRFGQKIVSGRSDETPDTKPPQVAATAETTVVEKSPIPSKG